MTYVLMFTNSDGGYEIFRSWSKQRVISMLRRYRHIPGVELKYFNKNYMNDENASL